MILGFIILACERFIMPIPPQTQAYLFFAGIIFLGIPHGAADLMVGSSNAGAAKKNFSKLRFLMIYISLLIAFAAVLRFMPLAGNLLFLLFAAYHFGETDLYHFKTGSVTGKLFVTSYGLLILSVILLNHFEEVKPLLLQFDAGVKNSRFINWLDQNRYQIMSVCGVLFFSSTFTYQLKHKKDNPSLNGRFLIVLAVLLFILFNMPMLIGFTFYFVAWHSLLSLKNIITYLRKTRQSPRLVIAKEIFLYSSLAMIGIVLFGLTGFMFMNNAAAMSYLFLGLAVLTAPHMLVMHHMYHHIRVNNKLTEQSPLQTVITQQPLYQ
jgi:Brp/Blh family beta-carotene 15,15'-monooxygenase